VGKLSKYGATFQEIASRLGKPLRWVAQRKAVSQLIGPWLRALRADKLTLAAAEELARWPQAVQARLAAEHDQHQRAAPLSESTVKYWLQSEMHLLSAAPWSLHDADLYPQAGACGTCPKRSGCAGVLFEQPSKGKDACLDKGCWGVKLARRTTLAIKENSTEEQPAYRLSSRSYETPAGALAPGRYEVSKKKKGTVAGVFIDGPQQAHAVRVVLVDLSATAQKNNQEAQHEARRKRLTQQATKSVLAGRIVVLFGQPDEEGEQVRRVLLGEAITERLLHNRTALDELMLTHLVRDWKWPVMLDKTRKAMCGDEYRQWVRAQVMATAPTEKVLTRLLLYVLAHHDLSSEYNDQQQKVAVLLNRSELTQGLAEAAQDRLAQQYDPLTLRARS
ncbi:hypothetical protein, partial [Hymenobacter psoromatis]